MPSRALFAVAISAAHADRLAIVGTDWDNILDFGDIEEEGLAAKLTDDHIRDVLLCVDAVNRVTRLMLTGCINVTGAGLEPLRGSLAFEQLDLSRTCRFTISPDHVLPILDSIIEQERCALKNVHFPRLWRSLLIENGSDFQQFMLRYNQMWARRQDELNCSKCSASLPQRNENYGQMLPPRWVHDVGGLWIQPERPERIGNMGRNSLGTDMHTCYKCLKHYCRNCEIIEGDLEKLLDYCRNCDKMYCGDCVPILGCQTCNNDNAESCSNCAPKEQICGVCGAFYCESDFNPCNSCGVFCNICSDSDEATIICEECNECLCGDCRSQSRSKEINCCSSCPEHEAFCNGCRVRHLSEFLHCNECVGLAKIHLLEEKIGGLTEKNEELTKKNKELTDINEQLRGKIKTIMKIEGETEQHQL